MVVNLEADIADGCDPFELINYLVKIEDVWNLTVGTPFMFHLALVYLKFTKKHI